MGRILLVRHGQASWGSDDYDRLSPTGHEQARVLGASLAARGIVPDVVLRGSMRRHRETAENCVAAAGWDVPVEVDDGWDEFDHDSMLSKVPSPYAGREPNPREFQAWFEASTDRWVEAHHDDYTETFAAFTARVEAALTRTTAREGTVVVLTSGGPVSAVCAGLLADDPGTLGVLWRRLNPVCINAGVTRLVTGRRGTTLVSWNAHDHLDATPELLTYR